MRNLKLLNGWLIALSLIFIASGTAMGEESEKKTLYGAEAAAAIAEMRAHDPTFMAGSSKSHMQMAGRWSKYHMTILGILKKLTGYEIER